MELPFAKEDSAILKDLLHYLGSRLKTKKALCKEGKKVIDKLY